MAIEKTFILVKPDAVKKNLVRNILARFEAKGLKIVALKMIVAPKEVAETHYAEHKEKPFFGELVDFITSSPLVAAVIEGENAIKAVRQLNGATNPLEAVPGCRSRERYFRRWSEHSRHGWSRELLPTDW